MRIEIGGCNITERIAEVIESLQNDPLNLLGFNEAVTNISQRIMTADEMDEADLADLKALYRMLSLVKIIANDPSLYAVENDVPTASF